MKVAVIHYHAKPGGVTTVIRQQAAAARGKADFLLVTGEPPATDMGIDAAVVRQIGYDREGAPACSDPKTAADEIEAAVKGKWPGGCDLFHVHNPLLAKNRAFLAIIRELAARGHRLLLHVHDFAEDGRPGAYFADEPYPNDCHFCTINSRDREILIKAGANPEGVHLVPNMVSPMPSSGEPRLWDRIALYPVRAIRRKNIGEAILLSRYFENGERLHITLGPNSPADIAPYEMWKRFVRERGLDVVFEASLSHRFEDLVASASFMVTTSITEGFGFAFLEPWSAKKTIHGRRLGRICADFEKQGVRLDHMYDRIVVPVRWVGEDLLLQKITAAHEKSARAFGLCTEESDPGPFVAAARKELVDFGMLDEQLQQKVILRMTNQERGAKDVVARLNPRLGKGFADLAKEVVEINSMVVMEQFSSDICAKRLLFAYESAAGNPLSHDIDKRLILKEFFTPENFSLLKWGDHGSKV